jgi:hypothetical protein
MKIKIACVVCLASGLMYCQCAGREESYHIENAPQQEAPAAYGYAVSAMIVTTNTAAVSVTWVNPSPGQAE